MPGIFCVPGPFRWMLRSGEILPILRPFTCGPRCLAADAVRGAGCPAPNSRRLLQTSSVRERYRFLRTLKWRGFSSQRLSSNEFLIPSQVEVSQSWSALFPIPPARASA